MRMSKWRTVVAALTAAVFVAALVAGCATTSQPPAGGGTGGNTVLKIGLETGLTGPLPDYGYTAAEGAKLAAKDLNAKGVTIGGKKYTIEIVVKDNAADPAQAPVVAQGLVDAGVVGVVGPLTSGAANAGGPIYSKANMPQITASATLAQLTQMGWKNFFRNCVGDNIQGAALGKWANDLGFKKVAVMDDSSAYAVGLADNVIKNIAPAKSLRQSAKDTDTDFSAQITNIKNFGPDAIIFTGYHKQAGLLRKQMVEQGLGKVQMFGGDGVKSTLFAGEAGGAANAKGVYCTIGAFGTANPNELPLYAKFKTDYKAQTGKDPSTYAEGNYDAVGTLVAAMEQAGSTDHAAVVTALHSITYTGILGTYGFDANGDIAAKGASANVKTIFHFINDGKDFVPTTK